jgi:hypothetical protein
MRLTGSQSCSYENTGVIFSFFLVLHTQMWNIKLRPSKLIISSDAQKHMVGLDFERKFHDLKCFEVGFLSYSLNPHNVEGIITEHQLIVILSCLNKF